VEAAAQETKRQALRRDGYQTTLFAGETGGYKAPGTLLGGGEGRLG